MEAEKMFNELGWKKLNSDKSDITYLKESNSNGFLLSDYIVFEKESKWLDMYTIESIGNYDRRVNLTLDDFKVIDAVRKQGEELGWI